MTEEKGVKKKGSTEKKKVAAYCRVSTDREDQTNSLLAQQKYFREYIERNPLWELTEVYVDTGITGTSTKKRAAFNRMIAQAKEKAFDLIITKEISRFARNTLDSIFYTRQLKELGIGVIFMNDNINTLDNDGELRLTIMSSIAQEESRKTSDRVKWGQKRRMEKGVVFGRSMLGYDVKAGEMHINQEGAQLVRQIFNKFLEEGKGTHLIAKELSEAGIRTYSNGKEWSNTVILRILKNEKYVGDLVQQKTYTPSYLTHEKKYNKGETEFVILREHHEHIINRETFEKVQEELKRRRPNQNKGARHSSTHCFSGKIKCGICGSSFVSRSRQRKDGSTYRTWRCAAAVKFGLAHLDLQGNTIGCESKQLNNDDLMQIMSQVLNRQNFDSNFDKDSIAGQLSKIIKATTYGEHEDKLAGRLDNKREQLKFKKQRLIEIYINEEISKADFNEINTQIEKNLLEVEQEKTNMQEAKTPQKNNQVAAEEIRSIIRGMMDGSIKEATLYRNILDKIIVYPKGNMDIYLKELPYKYCCTVVD